MNSIDLAVIIVNFNTASLLKECLNSVEENRGNLKLEIFVVDNNSRDQSVEMIKKDFPQIKLMVNSENIGFARGVNLGLALAKGRYFLLLNPDVKVLTGVLKGMIEFMEQNKDAGLAGVQLLNSDGTKQNSMANFPSLSQELLNKSLLRILFPEKYPSKYQEYKSPIEVDSVIGACMIVRPEAVKEVGELDPGYFLFLEETDWCFQMKKKGWKIFHIPQLKIYHKQGQSLLDLKSKGRIEYYRSYYRFFKKNYSRISYIILKIIHFIKTMINIGLNLIASILTLGLKKGYREKFLIYSHLFLWQILGCPGRDIEKYGSFFKI
ncbi:MAG: glycosyltransferase family 2 protein [candidate division Zixibacteria bacterium]|nr:glycosyltransferase family 2 protein [candidate division Zixibacteria bacterium]